MDFCFNLLLLAETKMFLPSIVRLFLQFVVPLHHEKESTVHQDAWGR